MILYRRLLIALLLTGCGSQPSSVPDAGKGVVKTPPAVKSAWSLLPPIGSVQGAVRKVDARSGLPSGPSWLFVHVDGSGSLHGTRMSIDCGSEGRVVVSPISQGGWAGASVVALDRGGVVAPGSEGVVGVAASVACAGHGVAEVTASDAFIGGILKDRLSRGPSI